GLEDSHRGCIAVAQRAPRPEPEGRRNKAPGESSSLGVRAREGWPNRLSVSRGERRGIGRTFFSTSGAVVSLTFYDLQFARLDHPQIEFALAAGTIRGEVEQLAVTAQTRREVTGRRFAAVDRQRDRLAPPGNAAGGNEQAPAVVSQRSLQIHRLAIG